MENKKSSLLIYREKTEEKHTVEELKTAFDESVYSVCFNHHRGFVGAKHELFAAIWDMNPDAILTKADLIFENEKTEEYRDQFLLIDKNGNLKTANTIVQYMSESGIISYNYDIWEKNGCKSCIGANDIKKDDVKVRFNANLVVAGNRLILILKRL